MVKWLRSFSAVVIAASALTAMPAQAEFRFFNFDRSGPSFTHSRPSRAQPQPQQARISREFMRQTVPFRTSERAGTILVDTKNHFLYLVLENDKAIRYGIGVARSGFEWSGTHRVTRKAEWPGWTPPAAMRQRQPGLPAYMPGGPNNPLGARALYLGSTLYRIHGTVEPWSIGQNVSSGCIRMVNDDVIDLYSRVPVGAKVMVI